MKITTVQIKKSRTQIVIFSLLLATSAFSQVDKGPDMEIKAMTTGDTYQFDFEANFNYFKYMGIGLGVGFQSEFKESYGGYLPKNKSITWDITEDYEQIQNITIHPSLRLRTPYLKIRNNRLAFYGTPELIIYPFSGDGVEIQFTQPTTGQGYKSWSRGYHSSYFPIRVYGGVQSGFEYLIDEFAVIGGMEFSNQDVYAGRRGITFEGVKLNDKLPSKKNLTQSIFIGLRYLP